ncbi:MAG TPA: hypothetical protein DIT46_02020 [Gemmatimonadetes bacterium]|nr:hypothetical protein [Gemmatimonadota bacterium]
MIACDEVLMRRSIARVWRKLLAVAALFAGVACAGDTLPGADATGPPTADVPRHQVCTPGLAFCDGNDLWLCNDLGTDLKSVTCTGVCDEGECKGACEPDTSRCVSANLLEVCHASGVSTTQPCDNGCKDGQCLEAPVCVAGAMVCDPETGEVTKCNSRGSGRFLFEVCEYACDPDTDTCIIPVCEADARRCSANEPNVVEVCASDRSGWAPTEFCSDKCEDGYCKAINCAIGDVQCSAEGIEACKEDASGFELVTPCDEGCLIDLDGVPFCAKCKTNHSKCEGETVFYCLSATEGWVHYQQCGSLETCQGGACKALLKLDPKATFTTNYLLLTKAFVHCWKKGVVGFCRELGTEGFVSPIKKNQISDWFCDEATKEDFADEKDYDVAKDIMGCGVTNLQDLTFETNGINPNLLSVECIAFADSGLVSSKEIVVTLCENLK